MSSRDFEIKWKTALTSILEELSSPEFRKLIFSLDKIPQGRKAEKHREEFPDIIIQFYGTEGSISVINKEMKVLPRKDAKVQEPLQRFVEEVKKRRQKTKAGGSTAAPSTSAAPPPAAPAAPPAAPVAPPAAPAAPPPAAPASMTAQQGGIIFAPNVTGCTTGVWNVNFTK